MLKNPNSRFEDGYSDVLDFARVYKIQQLSQEYMVSDGTSGRLYETYSDLECYIWEQFNLMYRLGRGDIP